MQTLKEEGPYRSDPDAPVTPRVRKVSKKRDSQIVVVEVDDAWLGYKRAVAGFTNLTDALAAHKGELPDGERIRALPVLEFTSSANGRDAIKVAVDMRKIEPQYVEHVLVPIINALNEDVVSQLELVTKCVMELRKLAGLPTLVETPANQAKQAPPTEE